MKLGIGFSQAALTEENLQYAKQLGVTHVIIHGASLWGTGNPRVHRITESPKIY